MTLSKNIPQLDLMWLLMETPTTPTHIGGLLLFQRPAGRPSPVREIVEAYRSYEPVPPFNYVPKLGLRAPRFVESAHIGHVYHVQRLASGFLQTPSHPGRPCRAANGFPWRGRKRLPPPFHWRARKDSRPRSAACRPAGALPMRFVAASRQRATAPARGGRTLRRRRRFLTSHRPESVK
jgi:hypothetical protein